jgi:hypothetical protein
VKRLALILCLSVLPASAEEVASASGAVMRGLDKVSGATTDLEIRSGQTTVFGSLTISVSDCRYPVGDPSSNAYAHVTITDPAGKTPVFDGWMIASSPALSALDHPRYDVWVLRCMSV